MINLSRRQTTQCGNWQQWVGLALLALISPATGWGQPSTNWNSTVGDWTNASLWSAGLPTSTTQNTYINNAGTAKINGSAASQFVWLGATQGTSGSLEIGAGGAANFTTIVVGGLGGTGSLKVNNGGVLSTYGGPIGSDINGLGTALVDGAGSRWNISGGELIVGHNGNGTLTLTNGGVVNVANGTGHIMLAQNGISTGTVRIGDGGAAGTINAVDVYGFIGDETYGGTATVIFNHNEANYSFAPGIFDNTSVQHIGTGRTILTGPSSNYLGTTTISAGEFIPMNGLAGLNDVTVELQGTLGGKGAINGATTVIGAVSPGLDGAGVLTFGSNLTLQSTSTFKMELGGYIRGTQFDGVNITTALLYGGKLDISFLNGFEPKMGDQFRLFGGFTSQAGTFADIKFLRPDFGGTFNYNTGILTITTVPEPGSAAMLALGVVTLGMVRRRKCA